MNLLICTQTIDKNDSILGFFHGWVLEFAKHFDEVHVICLGKGEYNFPPHVHVYSLGKECGENRLKYFFRFYSYFSKIFLGGHVDYVFFHMGAIYNILAAPFFVIRKIFKTKFYWWKAHGHINWGGKLALLFVDIVYTASQESFPIDSRKKKVIGHAININMFNVVERTISDPIVLFVSRITPIKQAESFIDTVQILKTRGYKFQARIVGVVGDPKYMQLMEEKILRAKLSDTIQFIGPIKHDLLLEEYRHACVLVHPSETGSIDKVVLEAMASGVPVVALQKAYADLLKEFDLTVNSQDPVLYANLVEKVFLNREYFQQMSEKLRKKIISTNSLETLSGRIFGF
ncbi:MAG: glycosyltransferase family 4 protein [Candidatus Pacebacteria bacterium]|nr:glycosyltransferase family 4 protein [Candidatus Paceibacterota bacterium]MCF7856936.1 glycosyltransferase family 4 protein [Candidatus Paceibacterota bacterium]